MNRSCTVGVALAGLLLAAPGWALEIGTVAATKGSAEILRGEGWQTAEAGTALQQGDRLRTGNPGQMRVVFQDDTVLTLSDDTEVVLDESVFQPDQGRIRSITQLLRGAVNAVVSEYYDQRRSEYTIQTATATAGVRGTEFVVRYFPELGLAEVIGVSGSVEVRSTLADIEETVYVTAFEVTHVGVEKPPTPPQALTPPQFGERMQRFDIVGATRIETLAAWQGGVGAAAVVPDGRLDAFSARQERTRRPHDAGNLLSDSPALMTQRQLGVRF